MSTSENNPNDGTRRSGRKRVSTVLKIDGYDVLVKNNYVVTGMGYTHGAYTADAEKTKKQKVKPSTNVAAKPKKAPQLSAAEAARLEHNEAVKASIKAKESVRRDFIVKHKDVLEPFMDDHTKKMVDQWSKSKAGTPYREEKLFEQPELITGGEMRDYQLVGLNFMVNLYKQNIGMILGDEMGLGKTLQTISLLCYLKERNENTGPSLIVCPLSVLYSWCSELEKWAPSLKVLRLHSSNPEDQANQRRELVSSATKYDVIVTTYDMVKIPLIMNVWNRMYFRIVCLDEGHKIKSEETQISQAVRRIHCENRLLLTGTPLQNNLTELVSLLNFLLPDIFTNAKAFSEAFDITNNNIDKNKMMEAQKVLGVFMLRRLKDQVEKLMPKKIETKVYCPLSKKQVFWYKCILMKDVAALARQEGRAEESSAASRSKLTGLFMQLRKACLHPFLFAEAEPDISATTVEDLLAASGKLAVLDSLLISLFQKGHRCVLFSQFTSMLDIIADYCTMRGWNYLLFDGRTSRAKRNYYVNAFNAKNSPVFLFLMSTRSGSMGLNLQTADTCILYDSDFNPQMDNQAMARVHRIGQTKTVHVYRLVASGTVEERLIQRAEKKLLLDQMVNRERNGESKEDDTLGSMSAAELLKDIKFGSAAVFGDSSINNLPTKQDIAFITDRERTEMDSNGKLKGNATHNGATFNVKKELSDGQVFQGIDFRKLREEQDKKSRKDIPNTLGGIARLWHEISDLGEKRKKKSRIVLVDGMKSGYGKAAVPVLASNNYDLANGESSVFDRELQGGSKTSYAVTKRKTKVRVPENQEWCQHCGDGGEIYLCSRCPISCHKHCYKAIDRDFQSSCSHHHCAVCEKPAHHSGGLLYPCQSCPAAYCEDCLPTDAKGFRFLGACERFEAMGFDSTKTAVYIHCSEHCEEYAIHHFGWKPPEGGRGVCPEAIDVASHFGAETSDNSSSPVSRSSSVEELPNAASTVASSSSSDSGEDDMAIDLTGDD